MKYHFIYFILFLSFITNGCTQKHSDKDSVTDYEMYNFVFDSIEEDRIVLQDGIKNYKDLYGTFWVIEPSELSATEFNVHGLLTKGYIFLSNNIVLIVYTSFNLTDLSDTKNRKNSSTRISYEINSIYISCKYEIKDDSVVFNFGNTTGYLKNTYLYISEDKKDYKKYRIENKFYEVMD
ncbi:MAG: hypothetical protein Ta2G_17440 [Termitinemataceae bacterium]|nr:MAG: hypothetical protein Ta2G_17440 [Termitinemataceae bacterium]